jgi:hypothetical protein
MKLPTDDELEQRAVELARKRWPGPSHDKWLRRETKDIRFGIKRAKLEDLKLARTSYQLLKEGSHMLLCAKWDDLMCPTGEDCTCGLDAHLSELEQFLGIEQTNKK